MFAFVPSRTMEDPIRSQSNPTPPTAPACPCRSRCTPTQPLGPRFARSLGSSLGLSLTLLVASASPPLSSSASSPPSPTSTSTSTATSTVVRATIRLATPSTLLLEASLPTNTYAIVERATATAGPFLPLTLVAPPDPTSTRVAIPIDRTQPTALFRLLAVPLDAPGDVDHDGMDDLYELRRSHVLDPLDPGDALRDADGDGDSNLTEYLSRTESAPPRADAPIHYATFQDLVRSADGPLPPLIHLGGYERQDDGWGGWFAWRENDRRTADAAIVVDLGTLRSGRLERIVEAGDPVHTAWWRPPSDGTGNAGPLLQKAVDFLATRPVKLLVIDPGRYHLQTQIAYSDPAHCPFSFVGLEDFTVEGAGATLVSTNDGELLMLKDCRRAVVRNLGLVGAGSDRGLPDGNYTAIGLVGQQSDLLFSRCSVTGFMHGLSHLHGEKTSVRVTVRECRFEDGTDFAHGTLGGDGAAISGIGDDWLVENCFFHECGRGIEIENTAKDLPITRVAVRGNRLTNVRNLGFVAWLGGDASGLEQQSDIIVRDNLIVGKSPRHIDPRGEVVPIMGISINGGSRWVVQGNIVYDADFAGISLYSNQAPIADCVVSGNVVGDIGGRGIQIYTTPALRTRGVVVSNNRIRDCFGPGILITGEHIIAQGNQVENTGIGISVGDTTEPFLPTWDVVIRANSLRSTHSGWPAIQVAASAVDYLVTENDVAVADIGIRDESGRGTIDGNHFSEVDLDLDFPNQ